MGRPTEYENNYPGVTSVIGKLLPQDWKAYWFQKSAAQVGAERILSLYTPTPCHHKEECGGLEECETRKITAEATRRRKEKTDGTVDSGHSVHKALEGFLKGVPLPSLLGNLTGAERTKLTKLTSYLDEQQIKAVEIEKPLVCPTLQLGGTPDIIFRRGKTKRLHLGDLKTGNNADKVKWQYQFAFYSLLKWTVDKERVTDGEMWQIGDDLELVRHEFTDLPDLWPSCKRLRELYRDLTGK